ncbi:MAG: hypothetical protein ACRYGA_14335 [Janthinobacterium lividum]
MKRVLVILLTTVLLGAAAFLFLRDPEPDTSSAADTATVPADDIAGATASTLPPAGSAKPAASPEGRAADAQTPAWLLPTPRPGATNPPTNPANAANTTKGLTSQEKMAKLNAVLEKLNRLQARPTIDAKEAIAVIAELEQINGSPVMSGIRLDVLRENMQVASQIQTTANELQQLEKAPASQTPEQAALIQAKTAELAILRSRLRRDLMQSPDGAARP